MPLGGADNHWQIETPRAKGSGAASSVGAKALARTESPAEPGHPAGGPTHEEDGAAGRRAVARRARLGAMGNDNGDRRDEASGARPATPKAEDFDAVSAAEELEESLREAKAAGAQPDEGYVGVLEGEIAALQDELEKARARAEKAEARAASSSEEIERSKERIERESAREQERRLGKTLLRFLEVLDDLDRAIASAREMDHNPEVLRGVELVRKRFLTILEDFGVRHVSAHGEVFDPAWHDAMSTMEVSDSSQDGKVVQVVAEGYAIGEEVLRPARVIVGKAS